MSARLARRVNWLLPLALYAVFLWRSLYSTRVLALGVLDWLLPALGLGIWIAARWWRKAAWPRTALGLPLLAWLGVTLLTTTLSDHLRRGLSITWETLIGFLLLYLLVDAVRRGWSRVLWRVLYQVGAVVCVIGVVELLSWYFGWPLLARFQQGWPAIGGLAHPFPPTLYRIGVALVNNTALSAFVALLIPPAVSIVLTARDRQVRIGMGLWLAAAGGIVLLALARGGFVALAVSLPLLFLGGTRDPRFRGWWARTASAKRRVLLVGAAVIALVLVVSAGLLLAERLAQHSSGDAVRTELWRSAGAMFIDQPLTGVGPGAYGIELRTYRDPRWARDHITTAHNLYLNIAAEMGLPGLLVAGWAIVALIRAWWQRWRGEQPGTSHWWRLLGIGAALAGLAAQSMVDTFVESAILLAVGIFVALILASRAPQAGPVGGRTRWPWSLALAMLLLGVVGMAWDARGQAPFERSLSLARQGSVDDALAAVKVARDRDPAMPLYTCHSSYLYGLQAAEGDEQALQMAVGRYRECMAGVALPELVDQLNASVLLWQAGQREEARSIARVLTEQMPLQPRAWLLNGLWAELSGDRQEAVRSYRRVLTQDPMLAGSPFWTQDSRTGWWDEIVQSDKPAGDVPWRWQALLGAGRFEEAARDLDAWLEDHPQDIEAQVGLGETLVGQGRPDEAVDLLDDVLSQDRSNAAGFLARGEALRLLGRYEESEQDLRTALFLEPTPGAHLQLARLALDRGLEDMALREYARAMRPQVLMQSAYVVLYGRMGWPVTLPQVVQIGYRHDAQVALEWGELLTARGDTGTAAQVYEAALNLDSNLAEVRLRLDELDR